MIFNAYADGEKGIFDFSLVSAGHIFAQQGRRISRPEGREDWLLFYVAKGRERFTFPDAELDAQEGSFVLFRPHEPQEHVFLDGKTGEFYYVHFEAPKNFDLLGLGSARVYTVAPNVQFKDLFEAIITELQERTPYYQQIGVCKLLEIIALLARTVACDEQPSPRYQKKIFYVVQLLNTEFDQNRSLEEYAQICSLSKFHFLRVFKEITGASPIEYRNKLRMERAKALLSDLGLSISEISTQLGFSSPAYFCDAFKRKNGMSPMQYRKALRR